jgi:aspartate/methionine/tyrosine aminotransferase
MVPTATLHSSFRPAETFQAKSYQLLPLRFRRLTAQRYFLTNLVGEHLILKEADFRRLLAHQLSPSEELYRDLNARHFVIDEGAVSDPLYSTGVALSEATLKELGQLAEKGITVVLDLCLKATFHYPNSVTENPNIILLTSPHKAACLNGIKFSALIFDQAHTRTIEHWADALIGGLGFSSSMALEHYLSAEFETYASEFQKRTAHSRSFLNKTIAGTKGCKTDNAGDGYFQAVYFPGIPASREQKLSFLKKIFEKCGACFIPGSRNHFPPEWGFGFRVNHARDCPEFRGAISRLLDSLSRL